MAARSHPAVELLDLRSLRAADLEDLLEEETAAWREELDWDFGKSAELVSRFVDLRALHGFALVEQGAVIGYTYFVYEDQKGLVGDIYVRRHARAPGREERLLQAALHGMIADGVRRVEAQLMMAASLHQRPSVMTPPLEAYPRNFMMLEDPGRLPSARLRRRVQIQPWSGQHENATAQLIAEAYLGHVDSRINDQYRSVFGARRFLRNIVEYPGCGTFFAPGSYAAFDLEAERLCGVCLASLVAPECGHVTQVCVSPWTQGCGIGRELLRRSLGTLAEAGCRRASLTVTASNSGAVALYERLGFRTIRRFNAYIWES
ncbi:MAG: GNAT family N-acetyltransferase [Bryobacteraceae bacterium]